MTFTGAVPDGGPDTSVYFRFERLPYPDTEPSFNLDPVVVSGETEQQYTVTVPAQDAANTYESFLLYVVDQDQPVIVKDIAVNHDGGSSDDEITEPEYVAPTSSGISILTDGQIDALWGGDSSLAFPPCGTTCSFIETTVVADDQRGNVLQVSYASDATHAALSITSPLSVDVSAYTELSFDIKIINVGPDVAFSLIANSSSSTQVPVSVEIADTPFWQTVTVPVSSLSSVDLTDVTQTFVFYPTPMKGANLVYQLDDVRWQ